MKVFKEIFLTILGYTLASLLALILVIAFMWFAGFSLTFIRFIPNKDSIFYEFTHINYSNILPSAVVSFILCFTFMFIYSILRSFFLEKVIPQSLSHVDHFVWTILTTLFLTLTLIFWLDERSFTIATSVISFFALLFPLSKRFWDNKNLQIEKQKSE
ncbi:hypothetical protein NGC25_13840 [Enterococcus faecalis]|uniref:hypothetical protein n=1 Tax=Enterococcus faecalis TaxID=1351 RepID=UPI002DBFEDE3|nr:hypothetical protein [Enterococcus faecalis]MEB7428340.1 hypothetical protein [Enterococcus faecalis]